MKKVEAGIFNFAESEVLPVEKYFDDLKLYCNGIGVSLPEFEVFGDEKFPILKDLFKKEGFLSLVKLNWSGLHGKLRYLLYTKQVSKVDIPQLIIFFIPNEWPISGNYFLHGGSVQNYKEDFAIVGFNKKYRELFFHEIMHYLGAQEGYNEQTLVTLKGCESCWMQYDPKNGNGLCKLHQDELIKFLKSV